MKERPILFSAPMVRAILNGRKTQTRRIVKPQPVNGDTIVAGYDVHAEPAFLVGRLRDSENAMRPFLCPFGATGDRLWVRETWAIVPRTAYRGSQGVQQTLRPDEDHDAAIYRADWKLSQGGIRWRPSIHMPRWASRITLEITAVRVERLQEISEKDAVAEGVTAAPPVDFGNGMDLITPACRRAFARLWESIHGPGSWAVNPLAWAISFRRVA